MKIAIIPNDLSMDFEKVCRMCHKENVKYLELASMWNKGILDLNEEELGKVHALMDKYDLQAASIQTQIMKVLPPGSKMARPGAKTMHGDYEYNISRIDRAIELAKEFKAKYIISYSFMGKAVHSPATREKNWQLMFDTYAGFLPKLQAADMTICLECDGGQYVGSIDDHLRLFEHFNSPHINSNFDMANLYHVQEFTREDFERFWKWVPYFHVKDRQINKGFKKLIKGGNRPAIFGEGTIPWPTVLPWFAEKGFDGFLSVEPHVHGGDKFEKGRQCVKNLQSLLQSLEIEFI